MWKVYLVVLVSVTIGTTEANSGCTSTEKGDCCVFPFKYKREIYHSCTFADSSKPWCALTSDYDTDAEYGYCSFKTCEIKTTDGDCCVFPFTYSGVTYNACTKVVDTKPWCGTKSQVEFWSKEPRGSCEHYADPCFYSPCKNGGTCQSNKYQFSCKCTSGWEGKTCTEKEDPCGNSPCQNGAKCFSDLDNEQFHCSCSQGYEGKTCENRVYPCDSSPCENGGTCTNNEHTYKCACSKYYEGDTCETKVCSPTDKGDCCVFPFTYKGKNYDSCTFVDSSKPWCALSSSYDKDKKYGYCVVKSCPSTVTENGHCCVFPFKYKGKTYDSCSLVDSSKPWCALTSDYDMDKRYGYCAVESTKRKQREFTFPISV